MRSKIKNNNLPRHNTRRAVLMAMFAHQLGGENDIAKLTEAVTTCGELTDPFPLDFFEELLKAAMERENFADSIIVEVADNWELERISAVDRNILRIGIAELLEFPSISPNVTLDEAVELAKEFGSAQSSKFVNGVLDAALKKLIQMGLITSKGE